MTDHKVGLMIHESRAFVERTAWHVICVVNVSATVDEHQRIISDDIGTGTACAWKDQKLILTADHLIGEAEPASLKFLLRVGDAIDWESNGRTGFASSVSLPIKKIVRCKEKDLAAIVLEPGELEGLNIRFCELPKKLARNRSITGEGGVLLIGYPFDQTFEVSELKTGKIATTFMACVPTPLMGAIVSKPEQALDSSYDADRDILLRFDPSTPEMKPHGFSGAGVWCDPAQRSGVVWSADPLLFGVQTSWYGKSGLLKAVGAPAIREFLEGSV